MNGVLDTINTNPVYKGKVPSTGKTFTFRGYTAGEEQALLVAKESKDFQMILANVEGMIEKCSFGEVNPKDLSGFDIEYLLLMFRAKSVGEEVELSLICKECEKTNDVIINLDEIKPPNVTRNDNVIALNDNVSVIMRYPGFESLEELATEGMDAFSVVSGLISSVVNGDDIIKTSELDPEEVRRFVVNMNSKSIEKMKSFIQNLPCVEHTSKVKCLHCGHDNEYTFKGIKNFFA